MSQSATSWGTGQGQWVPFGTVPYQPSGNMGALQPQFDFGALIGPILQTVVPAILSALSSQP